MQKLVKGRKFDTRRRAVIAGTGSAVPSGELTNHDLEKMVDTNDQWITTRTGIKTRRIASDGQTTASLAIESVKKTLEAANCKPDKIDAIICATITQEMIFPATACFIQEGIGNNHACAFDITAACSGFTYGMGIGGTFISSGQFDKVLIIGAETLSTIINYKDRTTCILFGDGAGSVLLEAKENTDRGLIYNSMHSDGNMWETLSCRAYGSRHPVGVPLENENLKYMEVRGRETYQMAVRRIVDSILECYRECDITIDDVTLVIPHQMNARIIESVVKRLKMPTDKMYVNIDRYGNTSAASIPLALDEAVRAGKAKKGDLVALVAFGGGLTWATNLVKL